MDLASLIGLLVAIASLIGAFALEGGKMGMLLVGTAAMIVFGGTFGATAISFTGRELKQLPYFFKLVFVNKQQDYNNILELLADSANKARREGFLSLENQLPKIENKFLVRGLQMVIDGTDPELTKDMLEMEIQAFENGENVGYEIFMTAGGFAPTMGIIGTVMGMVNVLSNLSNPETLGPAIAVAFLATLYGIFSANILWIPFANKIKNKTKSETLLMEMILEGILAIQVGENPRVLKEKLKLLVPSETRQQMGVLETEQVGV